MGFGLIYWGGWLALAIVKFAIGQSQPRLFSGENRFLSVGWSKCGRSGLAEIEGVDCLDFWARVGLQGRSCS